jgi:hypothetical protein
MLSIALSLLTRPFQRIFETVRDYRYAGCWTGLWNTSFLWSASPGYPRYNNHSIFGGNLDTASAMAAFTGGLMLLFSLPSFYLNKLISCKTMIVSWRRRVWGRGAGKGLTSRIVHSGLQYTYRSIAPPMISHITPSIKTTD